MKIRWIELTNFRQFKHERVEFSADEEKKVTVIYGRNYIGKTTLIKALLWALYKYDESFKNDPMLLNKDVQEENIKIGSRFSSIVSINLEHNGFIYDIRCSMDYVRQDDGFVPALKEPKREVCKTNLDGETFVIPTEFVDREIESILPSVLRNYFFYDGENNKIDNASSKSSLKDSVRNIMDLKTREDVISFFSKTTSTGVWQRFSNLLQSSNVESLAAIKSNLENEKDNINKEESNNLILQTDIEKLERQKQDLEDLIESNKQAEDLQTKLRNARTSLSDLKAQLHTAVAGLVSLIGLRDGKGVGLAGVSMATIIKKTNLQENYKNLDIKEKSYAYQSESSIDEIIKKGVCICGEHIKVGDEHYQHLINAKEYLPPRDYSTSLSHFLSAFDEIMISGFNAGQRMQSSASSVKKLVNDISDEFEKIKEMSSKLSGFRGDIGEWHKQVEDFRDQISVKKATIKFSKETIIPRSKANIDRYEEQLDKIADNNESNKKIKKYLAYVDAVCLKASQRLEDKKARILKYLRLQTNQVFQSILGSKQKELHVDQNTYNVEIYQNGSKTGFSTAEGIAKNLAFVAGLIYLAKNKNVIDVGDDDGDVPEDYPLFIDAPFSELDELNVENTARELPKYCSQLVITVLDKDYKIASKAFSKYVGKTYNLVTSSNTHDSKFNEEKFI